MCVIAARFRRSDSLHCNTDFLGPFYTVSAACLGAVKGRISPLQEQFIV